MTTVYDRRRQHLDRHGLAGAVDDVEALWYDDEARKNLMRSLELRECEPSVLGVSTHLLGVGRRSDDR